MQAKRHTAAGTRVELVTGDSLVRLYVVDRMSPQSVAGKLRNRCIAISQRGVAYPNHPLVSLTAMIITLAQSS